MIVDRIIFEDNHLICINKLCSEIVQGDSTGDQPVSEVLKEFIKVRDSKPGNVFLGVCHRLDRPTSGAVIFAKTGKALSRMNDLFRNGRVEKTYWAVTADRPKLETGTLTHVLLKDSKTNKSYTVNDDTNVGKKAILTYTVIARSDNYYLLDIRPKTGRHHQIRAQLSAVGCPVKGDLKYGAPRSNRGGGIHLHARSLEFDHPVRGDRVKITASVPDESLWLAFERMVNKCES